MVLKIKPVLLHQVADGKNDLDSYKNGFVNLALPLMAFSSPIASSKLDVNSLPNTFSYDSSNRWIKSGIVSMSLGK